MKNAIFIADTRAWAIGALLLQIQEQSPNVFDEAIIFHNGLSESDKALMARIMPCRFVEYNCPLPKYLFENYNAFKYFTPLMFARYEMFNYLKEFDRVVWSDTDVLIQDSLEELLLIADETGFAITTEAPEDNSNESADICMSNFSEFIPEYNMNTFLNPSGLLAFSKSLKESEKFTDWCYEATIKYAKALVLPDQGVLNLLIQEFNIIPSKIPTQVYCRYPKYGKDCSTAKIIHSWGGRKFWNNWYLNRQYPKWQEMYMKWLSLGGTRQNVDLIPEVSVVIPCYKPDLLQVKECLDSLIRQEMLNGERYENFEIIIIAEPFEQEGLQDLVNSYSDNRIVLVFNDKKLGISASLNKGMRLAKGVYIARIDSDDIANPQRLYKQKLFLDNKDIQLCISDFEYFGDMNSKRKQKGGEFAKALSLITCPFDHPTVMFERAFFIKNNLWYDESRFYVEDWELWCRAFEKGMKVGSIPEKLLKHRWHEGQAGQVNSTHRIMNIQVGYNFSKLGLILSEEEMQEIRLWTGKLPRHRQGKLYRNLIAVLCANKKMKIYNQKALYRVLKLRFNEAVRGKMSNYPIWSLYLKNRVNNILQVFHSRKDKYWNKFQHKQAREDARSLLDNLCEISSNNRKHIFIIGTSTHENIGDAAIALAQIEFAKKFFPEYSIVEIPMYQYQQAIPAIKNYIEPEDMLWGIGGGNLGSRYLIDESIRRSFLSEFKNNFSVIFPQSVFFSDSVQGREELGKSSKVYNENSNLLMLQRDPLSHQYAIDNFSKAKHALFPDIVCSLGYTRSFERKGILSCIRDVNDESALNKDEYDKVLNIISNCGQDVTYRKNCHSEMINEQIREQIVYQELDLFAKHKLVVTDRLHGLIFAVITNTPCVAIKSEDHKIKAFMHFLEGANAVKFIDKNIGDLKKSIEELLLLEKISYPNFGEYFERLVLVIKEESENKKCVVLN